MLQFDIKVMKMKINKNLFDYFYKAGIPVQYHKNDIIYMQDDYSNNLYLVIKGRVRVYALSSNGEEITYDILDEGRIFGDSSFFQNSPRPTTVSAINDVELISCTLENLYPYLKDSHELTIALLKLMSQTCDYLSTLLKRSYTYNRFEKIASFLLEVTQTDNPNKNIIHNTIPYTHEEISTIVGLSRVTTTKVLNEFQKNGYIKIEYKKITVLNKEALSKLIR